MIEAALWGGLTGFALILGAIIALTLRPEERLVGLLLAFGGGALISAVAFELIGQSVVSENLRGVAVYIFLGALAFVAGDRLIERMGGTDLEPGEEVREGRGLAIVLGKVLDGAPEAFVLGISMVDGKVAVAYVAALFASNLPMAIGATTSLDSAGWKRSQIMLIWTGIAVMSATMAAIGYGIFESRPGLTSSRAEAFAAGAILAMLTNALLPEAYRMGGHRAGLLTAMGFTAAVALSIAD